MPMSFQGSRGKGSGMYSPVFFFRHFDNWQVQQRGTILATSLLRLGQ